MEAMNFLFWGKDQAQKEREAKRNGDCSAMEVDQGDHEGGRSSAFLISKMYFGSPNFNQRVSGRDQFMEASKDSGQSGFTDAMDASPAGPTLSFSTMGSPQILGRNQINPPPPPPLHARIDQNADQADAMATKVEKIYKQKEKEKEQYKADLAQKESELAEAKEKMRELD